MVKKEYCSITLTEAKYKAFVYAIKNHYWYQMYIGEGVSVNVGARARGVKIIMLRNLHV